MRRHWPTGAVAPKTNKQTNKQAVRRCHCDYPPREPNISATPLSRRIEDNVEPIYWVSRRLTEKIMYCTVITVLPWILPATSFPFYYRSETHVQALTGERIPQNNVKLPTSFELGNNQYLYYNINLVNNNQDSRIPRFFHN